MPDLPHFAYPFRFTGAAAAVVEQDSKDEIVACATAIILCPLGFRVELPAFGIPDPTFTQGAARTDAIEAALAEWEPRAATLVHSEPDALDVFVSNVTVRVGAPSLD
jgi:hypothetical protein